MKILFVCSSNNPRFNISPFIKSQGKSLINSGLKVDYFTIQCRGIRGYLKNIKPLRRLIKDNQYDVIHSHYSLSGWISTLTFTKVPKIVSFMGCDTYGDYDENGKLKPSSVINIISAKLLQFFVKRIIVKSTNLKQYVNLKNKVDVIPNGVDIKNFKPMSKIIARNKLGLKTDKKYILFLGDRDNEIKNFRLLESAQNICKEKFEILNPYPAAHDNVPIYLNACDVLVLTSYKEGSPNVIKEAMACNCPIVSTNVGDIQWVLGNTEGCYLTSFDPSDVAIKIKKALKFSEEKGRTKGRERILKLGLDSETVAKKIIKVYNKVLTEQ